ncbi:hypothetical protein GASC598I20_002870, partial [Gilliamella apicola SCGC AB-598-I20]
VVARIVNAYEKWEQQEHKQQQS